jgi:dimethylargininase
MLIALTHVVPEAIVRCELTYLDRVPIDYSLAVRQHRAYCEALKLCGAEVIELTENSEYPDGCFIEDTAVVVDELAVMARMGVESRGGEVAAIQRFLSQYREIRTIEAPGTLEGGDVMHAGSRIFAGLSPRTNAEAIAALGGMLRPRGYQVSGIAIRDCLHLKSACTFLGGDTLLVNPDWVDPKEFDGFRIIEIDPREPWAANSLRLGDSVLLGSEFPATAERIEKAGFRVITVEVSEFLKAEAGLTCSSLIFHAA